MDSANERLADAVRRRTVALLRFEAAERRKILKMLDRLFGDLVLQLEDSGIGGEVKRTSYQKRRLDLLFRNVERAIAKQYGAIAESEGAALSGLETAEMEWAAKILNRSLDVDFFVAPPLTSQQIEAAASEVLVQGAPSSEWWGRQSEKLLQHFKDQIRTGWLQGETNRQLLSRLRGGVDEEGNVIFDLSKGTKRGAEATIRTSVQAVANDARMRVFRENEDVIKGVQWVSTLDARTTVECASLDGLMWDLDGNPLGHNKALIGPPRHWNCRSVLVPVTKSFREMGIPLDEFPESTRASIDGQVPENKTFESWIREKPESYAEDVFGKRRAALWRAGKISVRDMTDQRGRELTLDQLRVQRDIWQGDYKPSYLKALKALDGYFTGNGVIMNEHGLNRVEGRVRQGKLPGREDVLEAIRKGERYIDAEGREARYLDGISVHFGKDGSVLTVLRRKKVPKGWKPAR